MQIDSNAVDVSSLCCLPGCTQLSPGIVSKQHLRNSPSPLHVEGTQLPRIQHCDSNLALHTDTIAGPCRECKSGSLVCTCAGSQVCNLSWSKNVNEIVSTHGYSQNQIIVWKHPTMTKLATLTGHTLRVLYLAVSPDGQTIVTGAGKQKLTSLCC